MLCKKCKTAIDDNDKVCRYCGAKVSNSGRNMKIALLCFALLVIGGTAYLASRRQADEEATVPPSAAQPSAEAPAEVSAAETQPSEIPEVSAMETPPSEDPGVSASPASEEPGVKYWSLIDDTLTAAHEYYEKYDDQVTFLTRHGYLYDSAAKDYVKTRDLIQMELLDESFSGEEVLILYLNADTVEAVTGVDIEVDPNSEEFMEIYCAYETDEGFALSSLSKSFGVILRKDYQTLLGYYNFEHGPVVRPGANDREYANIIATVSSYEFDTTGYDVRYLAHDDKYAAVAVSKIGDPSNIHEYLLEQGDRGWEIAVENFQTIERFRKDINAHRIDLNQDILPEFDINDFIRTAPEDMTALNYMLVAKGLVEETSQLSFADSLYGFAYQEYDTGQVFLFKLNEQGNYDIYPCTDGREAEKIMRETVGKKPLFLIRQK